MRGRECVGVLAELIGWLWLGVGDRGDNAVVLGFWSGVRWGSVVRGGTGMCARWE